MVAAEGAQQRLRLHRPDARRPVEARSGEIGAAGAEGDKPNVVRVSPKFAQHPAAGCIPQPGAAVVVGGCEQPAIGAIGDAAHLPRMRPQLRHQLAAFSIPDARHAVTTAGRHLPAVGAEDGLQYPVRVAERCADFLPGLYAPDARCAIFAGAQNSLPRLVEECRAHGSAVAGEAALFAASGSIQQAQIALGPGNQDRQTIGAEQGRVDRLAIGGCTQADTAVHLPDAHRAVVGPDDNLGPVGAEGGVAVHHAHAAAAAQDGAQVTVAHIPQAHRAVFPGGEQRAFIGAEECGAHLAAVTAPGRQFFFAVSVPYAHAFIFAAGDEQRPVGAEGDGESGVLMPVEALNVGWISRRPDTH